MEVKGLTREYRMRQWAGFISGRNGIGKTVRVWCEEQGVNEKSYYYWQQKIREALGERLTSEEGKLGIASWKEPEGFPARSCFAEITPARGVGKDRAAAVTLTLNGTLVDVHNGADGETIRSVLLALKRL